MQRRWDIFCAVVDNFGDIGVCWRLARRLAGGLGQTVRLWVDDLAAFQRLCARVDPARAVQRIDGIEIAHWTRDFPATDPAEIVVEGFGATLPPAYLDAMATRRPPPVWINLEYLSAEDWVDSHHGLPSPHPRLALTKYFYFPGFTAAAGGVLIEDGLAAARAVFQHDRAARAAWWGGQGVKLRDDTLTVSLFCYDNAALPGLLAAWAADPCGVDCVVTEGYPRAQVERLIGRRFTPGVPLAHGALTLHAIPFLDVDAYDRLLWACDLNCVRGEDSFVRAQLAARPLLWQAYPQDEAAHLVKAAAFRDRYAQGLAAPVAGAYAAVFDAWNAQAAGCGAGWAALREALGPLAAHAGAWAERLQAQGDLAAKLAEFCELRLQ